MTIGKLELSEVAPISVELCSYMYVHTYVYNIIFVQISRKSVCKLKMMAEEAYS